MALKTTYPLKAFSTCLLILVLNLSAILAAQNADLFETIVILSPPSTELRKQTAQECDQKDRSAYNLCYGRGIIFDVCPSPEPEPWRKNTSIQMKNFYDKMQDAGIGSNPLLASLSFRWSKIDESVRFTLPYIFFSGDKAKITSRIYLTEAEATNATAFLPAHVRNQVEKVMNDNSIDVLVKNCFPGVFTQPRFRELFFIFRANNSSSPEEWKLPALAFRKFIYNHFIDGQEYSNFLKGNPLTQFIGIVNNLVGYSDGCSPEEPKDAKIFTAHGLVLELALQERFLREKEMDLLLNVFGEENIDDLFGQGSHGEIIEEEADSQRKKGMSFCFHQSEQGLLRYILETDGNKKYHNEFTSLLINFIKDYFYNKFNNFKEFCVLVSGETVIEPPFTSDDLPSLQEIIKEQEIEPTPTPSLKKNRGAASKSKEKPKELRVGVKPDVQVDLDIISPRHICKYCRGTFYFCWEKIFASLKDIFLNEGIIIRQNERPYGELLKLIAAYLKLKEPLPPILRIKFLGEVKLNILATASIAIKDELMGKMEEIK